MYTLYGFSLSFNTTKVLYTAEELAVPYEYKALDFSKGENKSPEHLKRHPLGKTPTLEYQGKHLFESGAICRFLALETKTPLYSPENAFRRALIEQWMDFHTAHLGRWIGTYLFEKIMKPKFGLGPQNPEVEKEALGFLEKQLSCVDAKLKESAYLVDNDYSLADLFAFSYIESLKFTPYSLENYGHINDWLLKINSRPSIKSVKEKLS